MKKKLNPGEQKKDGTEIQKFGGKEYEARYSEKMGADGVIETHVNYTGQNLKRLTFLGGDLKCRNVMSNADRKRLGLPEDR